MSQIRSDTHHLCSYLTGLNYSYGLTIKQEKLNTGEHGEYLEAKIFLPQQEIRDEEKTRLKL